MMIAILDKLLQPPVLALSIPVLAVLLWGLTSLARALRGAPEDLDAWRQELETLRARVDELERAQQPVARHPRG